MKLSDFFVMMVHAGHVRASRPPSRVANAVFSGLGKFIGLFGVKPLATVERW